jgi:hypothetical protein
MLQGAAVKHLPRDDPEAIGLMGRNSGSPVKCGRCAADFHFTGSIKAIQTAVKPKNLRERLIR